MSDNTVTVTRPAMSHETILHSKISEVLVRAEREPIVGLIDELFQYVANNDHTRQAYNTHEHDEALGF